MSSPLTPQADRLREEGLVPCDLTAHGLELQAPFMCFVTPDELARREALWKPVVDGMGVLTRRRRFENEEA